jgi:hypothetical protein
MADDAITNTSLDDIDALRIEAAEHRARGTPLYVTEEAIDRNPWAAVILDLPKDASKELLERVTETAFELICRADQEQLTASDPNHEQWRDLAHYAESSWETARLALDQTAAQHHARMQKPHWKQVDNDWEMIVGGETVAALIFDNDPQPFPELKWLSHILTDDLPEHGWSNVDFTTLEHAQYTLEQWWDHAQRGEAYRPARQDNDPQPQPAANQNAEPQPQSQPFTEQDLYRDPWSAVYQPIPADVDQTLLELAHIAVSRCQASVAGGEPELVNRLFTPTDLGRDATPEQNFERATERLSEIEERLDRVRIEAAWQSGEFSRDTIAADAWTAVYLKIPENADPALLAEARNWTRDLMRYAAGVGAFARPLATMPEGAAEPLLAATERLAELDARLENVRGAAPVQESTAPELPPERSFSAMASALFGAGEKLVSGIFESLADMISASPPLTFEQAQGLARAEGERAQHAWAAQYARHAEAADDYRRELAEQSQVGDGNVPEETLTPEERQSHSRGRGR